MHAAKGDSGHPGGRVLWSTADPAEGAVNGVSCTPGYVGDDAVVRDWSISAHKLPQPTLKPGDKEL